jgi:hypothetical protein
MRELSSKKLRVKEKVNEGTEFILKFSLLIIRGREERGGRACRRKRNSLRTLWWEGVMELR